MSAISQRRIGVFPGTFDPVHYGHIALAQAALIFGLDEIWLMPNPHVTSIPIEKGREISALDQRIAMAQLAVERIPRISVYTGELVNQPHNMGTFLRLQSRYPEFNFVYLMGIDAFSRLYAWDDYESVVDKATFLVANRTDKDDDMLGKLQFRLGAAGPSLRFNMLDLRGFGQVSGSSIRRELRSGLIPKWLDARVLNYIHTHSLYEWY